MSQYEVPKHLAELGFREVGSFHSSTEGTTKIEFDSVDNRRIIFEPKVEHGLSVCVDHIGPDKVVLLARVIQDIGGRGYVYVKTDPDCHYVTATFVHARS